MKEIAVKRLGFGRVYDSNRDPCCAIGHILHAEGKLSRYMSPPLARMGSRHRVTMLIGLSRSEVESIVGANDMGSHGRIRRVNRALERHNLPWRVVQST